jgi:hypothetical protein
MSPDRGHFEASSAYEPTAPRIRSDSSTQFRKLDNFLRILTAKLRNVGRDADESHSLDLKLAQRLAHQAVADLRRSQKPSTTEDQFLAVCATWFGLTSELGLSSALTGVMTDLEVHYLESSGGPRIAGQRTKYGCRANNVNGGGAAPEIDMGMKTNYAIVWRVETAGGMKAECRLNVDLDSEQPSLSAATAGQESGVDTLVAAKSVDPSDEGEAAEWKRRYLASERERAEERATTTRRILEAVL